MSMEAEINSKARPTSVTVISWIMISLTIVGWIAVIGTFIYMLNEPYVRLESPGLFILIPTISAVVQIIIGVGMLRGRGWARSLFIWLIPISVVIGVIVDNAIRPGILVKIILYLVVVYFLSRPIVKLYFSNAQGLAGSVNIEDMTAKELFETASQSQWQGEPARAKELYQRIIDKYPDAPEVVYATAELHALASLTAGEVTAQASGLDVSQFYAGFWKRLAAWFLDLVILVVLAFGVGVLFATIASVDPAELETGHRAAEMNAIFNLIAIVLWWIYYATMESSSKQATLGKLALGIKVTDMQGQRISFARASGRHFAKYISGLLLGIGFLMIAFSERKQGLHDMMADCLVVNR